MKRMWRGESNSLGFDRSCLSKEIKTFTHVPFSMSGTLYFKFKQQSIHHSSEQEKINYTIVNVVRGDVSQPRKLK